LTVLSSCLFFVEFATPFLFIHIHFFFESYYIK